jgi:4-hydroxybenzoyl-CoA reductase subunit alpha
MRPEELRKNQAASALSVDALHELVAREFSVIGSRLRKVQNVGKVTGDAVYTDDLVFPGMLHAKILRSPHPHASIISIDTTEAEALMGVHAVVTGKEMAVAYGIIPWTRDEYPLCVDRVRYVGDGVAAVAAVDEDTALRALELIRVRYELLPAYLTPEAALAADSGPTIHEAGKPGTNGNITKHVHLEFGEVDKLLEESAVLIE